jgi:hypothetical protein
MSTSNNGSYKSTKKLIFSSSHDPNTTNPADFTVNFANSDFSHGNISGLIMVDMVIPNMFYNVNETNRRISITDAAALPFPVTYIVDMPLGQYTATQFMDEFLLQLNAIAGGTLEMFGYTINPITGVIESVTMNNDYAFNYDASTASYIMGMSPNAGLQIPEVGKPYTPGQESFNCPVNFGGVKTVLIKTDLMSSNTTMGKNNKQESIIDFISLADTCFGTCKHHHVWDDSIRHHDFPSNTSLQSIHFQLVDINGDQLILPCNSDVSVHISVFLRQD